MEKCVAFIIHGSGYCVLKSFGKSVVLVVFANSEVRDPPSHSELLVNKLKLWAEEQ
jgi:hypothetical protein